MELRQKLNMLLFGAVCLIMVLFAASVGATSRSASESDWRTDWTVRRGFNIVIDAQGFEFPTAIAFVPNPGSSPKDPIYFVTELKGAIKVVTNDRSVITFAEDFFRREAERVMPSIDDEVGLAGICLDAENGYVFVTFAYRDSDNLQRNNVVRFESKSGTFSHAPTAQMEFTELFAPFSSIPSHQIGPCQVNDGLLYVNVADGGRVKQSQQLDSLLGKVLRMTLDGQPAPGNPFYRDDNPTKLSNYVWASGLRNPFGLKIVGDQVFVADNGPDIDRFLEITKGGNYLWDGSNNSLGTNAGAVFSPGRGVAQMDFYPQDSDLFPSRFRDSFFLTVTGSPSRHREGIPAIMALEYDLERSRVLSVPVPLLRYRGSQVQVIAAAAFGLDGLYFAPLFPNEQGLAAVFKVQYDPAADYPFNLEDELNPTVLMNSFGCFACHTLSNNQGGTVGPILDRDSLIPRLETRLNSPAYGDRLRETDLLDQEPFISFADARRNVAQAEGLEKLRLWLRYRIQEPRFDDPNAQMPSLGLTEEQAASIATYLAGIVSSPKTAAVSKSRYRQTVDWIKGRLPIPTRANAEKYLAAFFGVGLIGGVLATVVSYWVFVRIRRRFGRR